MITGLAILLMTVAVALGARPFRQREQLAAVMQKEAAPPRSGTANGLYENVSDRLPATDSSYIGGSGAWSVSTAELFFSERSMEVRPAPRCFVCGNEVGKPYPDRDYYCDHCQSFISLNTNRR